MKKIKTLKSIALILLATTTVATSAYAVQDRATSCAVELGVVAQKTPDFISVYRESIVKNFLFNFSPLIDPNNVEHGFRQGFIYAGQGRGTHPFEPDYSKYMWQRDSGISLTILIKMLNSETDPQIRQVLGQRVLDVLEVQMKMLMGGNPGMAKFDTNVVGVKEWMNPQDDGPAYMLKALTYGVSDFLKNFERLGGRNGQFSTYLTKADIYSPSLDKLSLIKTNLEYISHHAEIEFDAQGNVTKLPSPSYEAWEEELGIHFTNLIVQGAVLSREFPDFAKKMGDNDAANFYLHVGANIEKFLMKFWDPVAKVIRPSLFIDESTGHLTETPSANQSNLVKNHAPKLSRADTQVLIGIAHGKSPVFSPASDYAMATSMYFEKEFRDKYPINHGKNVVLMGRYLEDVYDSAVRFDPGTGMPTSKGEAWPLITFYESEICYKRANEIYSRGNIAVNVNNVEYLNYVLKQTGHSSTVSVGQKITSDQPLFTEIVMSQFQRGDLINAEVMKYAGQPNDPVPLSFGKNLGASWPPNAPSDTPTYATGLLSEQIHVDAGGRTGIQAHTSDPSLTWSYATYFRSLDAREIAIKSITQNPPGHDGFKPAGH